MRMRHLSLCLLVTAVIQSLCYADVTKLPAQDRKALLDASRFHEVHSTKDLPPAVVALCVDDKGKLAEPGQNWNATDAVTDPTLPWKRLIWVAIITLSITSAAESLTVFTSWLPNCRRVTGNRK